MTLKYLRGLSDKSLKNCCEHSRYMQLKWFDIYEYNYKNKIQDKMVCEFLERFTRDYNKCKKVLNERGYNI